MFFVETTIAFSLGNSIELLGNLFWQGLPWGSCLHGMAVTPAPYQLERKMLGQTESTYLEGVGLEEGCDALTSHSRVLAALKSRATVAA